MRRTSHVIIAAAALTCAAAASQAASYSYTDIVYPGQIGTTVTALNSAGVVVGRYFGSDGSTTHGMIYDHGTYTTIDPPGSLSTEATGIADDGTVVGYFEVSRHRTDAFIYHNGAFTTFGRNGYATTFTAVSPSGVAYGTQAMNGAASIAVIAYSGGQLIGRPETWRTASILATNGNGVAVGGYLDSTASFTGALVVNDTMIKAPGGPYRANVVLRGVNNAEVAVGDRYFHQMSFQGVITSQNSFQVVNYPGAADTLLVGIDAAGDMAGIYDVQFDGLRFSFVLHGGVFTSIAPPGAQATTITAMNAPGQIIGNYDLGNSNPCFIGTPQ